MNEAELLKIYILREWRDSIAARYCTSIIDFIVSHPENHSKILTYTALSRIVGRDSVDQNLLSAISILSSRFDTLVMHFMYVDDNGEHHYLTDDEAAEYFEVEDLSKPLLVENLSDVARSLYPYYEGNRKSLCKPAAS